MERKKSWGGLLVIFLFYLAADVHEATLQRSWNTVLSIVWNKLSKHSSGFLGACHPSPVDHDDFSNGCQNLWSQQDFTHADEDKVSYWAHLSLNSLQILPLFSSQVNHCCKTASKERKALLLVKERGPVVPMCPVISEALPYLATSPTSPKSFPGVDKMPPTQGTWRDLLLPVFPLSREGHFAWSSLWTYVCSRGF